MIHSPVVGTDCKIFFNWSQVIFTGWCYCTCEFVEYINTNFSRILSCYFRTHYIYKRIQFVIFPKRVRRHSSVIVSKLFCFQHLLVQVVWPMTLVQQRAQQHVWTEVQVVLIWHVWRAAGVQRALFLKGTDALYQMTVDVHYQMDSTFR